jgi:hypothetical protein
MYEKIKQKIINKVFNEKVAYDYFNYKISKIKAKILLHQEITDKLKIELKSLKENLIKITE